MGVSFYDIRGVHSTTSTEYWRAWGKNLFGFVKEGNILPLKMITWATQYKHIHVSLALPGLPTGRLSSATNRNKCVPLAIRSIDRTVQGPAIGFSCHCVIHMLKDCHFFRKVNERNRGRHDGLRPRTHSHRTEKTPTPEATPAERLPRIRDKTSQESEVQKFQSRNQKAWGEKRGMAGEKMQDLRRDLNLFTLPQVGVQWWVYHVGQRKRREIQVWKWASIVSFLCATVDK